MTKRIRQHQLEDISRSKFSLVLPENWVVRDKDKDYGIDAEVEIFDKAGKATGLVFWVQLKATETKTESKAKKVDLKIDSIKYYQNLEIPVLIARYSVATDTFYCKWAHDIDLFFAKEGAKTFRILFGDNDTWDEKSNEGLEELLEKIRHVRSGRIKFPIQTSFEVVVDEVIGISRGALLASFRAAICEYSDLIDLRSEPKEVLLTAKLSSDGFTINLPAINGCGFHSIEDRERDGFVERLVTDMLLGCAISLAHLGQAEMAAQIALDKRVKQKLLENSDLLIHLLPYLLKTSYYCDIVNSIGEIIDQYTDNTIDILTLNSAVLNHRHEEDKAQCLEKFQKKCISKYQSLGQDRTLGIAHYNLGNHYRSRKLYRLAAFQYLNARKYEVRYLDESYYWSELGGVFFELGKYSCSANIYKTALAKGASSNVAALAADALMFAGKYQSALDMFSEYLDNNHDDCDEWHLKRVMLSDLIEGAGVKEQVRNKQLALESIDISKVDEEGFRELLEAALDLDLLCGLAWFNLGVDSSKKRKPDEAAFNFIMCGLTQTGDIEAWTNAVLSCLCEEVPMEYFVLSLRTAYFFNGDIFLSRFYEELGSRVNPKLATKVINQLDEILPKDRHKRGKIALRMEGSDGRFRNMLK